MFEKLKDFALDSVGWMVAKTILRQLTGQLVSWIGNGFNGAPAFISDPQSFFLNIGDSLAGQFIFNSPFAFLCKPLAPLGLDIRLALYLNYVGASTNSTRSNRSCTLTKIASNLENMQFYINGGIDVAGKKNYWNRWRATTLIPENNIYGAYMKADAELKVRVAGGKATNQLVADWGGGFKSLTNGINGLIYTPGDVINKQLIHALGTSDEALAAADEIGEMVDAVVGALANQVLTQGLSQLSSGGDSYTSKLRSSSWQSIQTAAVRATVRDQARSATAADQNEAQGDYEDAWNEQYDLAQLSLLNSQPPDPKVSYQNAFTSQCSTAQADSTTGKSYEASKAIDGSQDSFSYTKNDCAPLWWWQVVLGSPQMIDEVRIHIYPNRNLPDIATKTLVLMRDINDPNPVSFTIPDNTVDIIFTIPQEWRATKFRVVKFETNHTYSSDDAGLAISEFEIFRHLPPTVDARNVPSTFASTTALWGPDGGPDNIIGFDPRAGLGDAGVVWAKGTYYPLYTEPTEVPINWINVSVKDSTGLIIYPITTEAPCYDTSCPAPTLRYSLPLGRYIFEYVATEPIIMSDGSVLILRSATSTRHVTIE